MLQIKGITKEYRLKDQTVQALKGIDLCFRRNEFVSILGPSGCGKTTFLNIIGGLDRYTSGDLIIDGVSTKEYKDKDWDNYRNHRVGFVFQTYNLIPHQTILENVELALTLSGVSKKERRARAIEVLNKVGLGDKLKAKPNQLSGGQMQRVAIARALVNDPEIILADEPTGALDSKTSVQIMDLLKEVSADRLVIMVTHNPDLAKKYSSRIVRLLDGELMEDSMPYKPAECKKEIAKHKKELEKAEKLTTFKKTEKKKRMSFFTALSLSFKNLLTKKGRTIMVAFAGSIGIIGIALILAVSAGMTNYINSLQSQSLASYPVAVSAVNLDLENATALRDAKGKNSSDDEIGVYNMKDTLVKFGKYNYITKDFITHATNYFDEPSKNGLLNELQVSYASDMHLITTMNVEGSSIMYPINNQISFSALNGSTSATFFEGLDNTDYIRSVYNVYGTYPTAKDEIALVLNSSSVADYSVMSLGLETPTKKADGTYETLKFQDIIDNKTYTLVYHDGYYVSDSQLVCSYFENFNITDLNPGSPKFAEAMTAQAQMAGMVADTEHTLKLKITAVLTLKDDASGSIFNDGFMYTPALAEDYRNNCKNSNVVNVVKTKYSSSAAGDIPFAKPFTLRIAEIGTFSTILGGIDPGFFTYETPNSMITALHDYFNIDVTYEQVMDIYMQVYGASDVPTTVQFYANSFEGKDAVVDMIKKWNAKPGVYSINYTDSSSMLTNMLGNIVNIISYVLIAFAAISLVVSSIMISIITYTSVIERTKEIGVLRSVGASKRDVSRVFNAETIIIGLLAGLIGVGVSWLLTLPIGLILKSLTGVAGLVVLQPLPAVLLVVVSTVLTFVAGLVPASIAAKKDPVLALRAE